MRRGTLNREESSRCTATGSMSSATRPRDRPRCRCGYIMVAFIAKRGRNAGREFWRCPNWKMKGTCDLLLWTDEFEENTGAAEEIESSLAAVGSESEAVSAVAMEVLEARMKKISKLQKKVNAERLRGDCERFKRKIATFFLVVSVIINVLLCIKYVF